ncbi:putative outer membrane transport/efflux protein [Indibacter alkaliphilus LW1]|uniref:Outer membrane transport/efflux protein n=1 Tax=Indibacter alkaliphilus (strain CCUG 57479 / KCTC 22604 / LW1) TaxID=1189612 RepID=S2D900_INDAL|nr:TolC family protein [Indibacter alkaliphilus]EOZ95697.1 putative outer membrane transport/efflux protein [Indibacter alkaliphilus LW1]
MKIQLSIGLLLVFFFALDSSAQFSDISNLDLETCIETALENNLQLKRSQVNLATQEANLIGNVGQRIPTLSTGGSSGYRWGRSINPVTNLFENNRIGNVNLFANANMTLFAGQQITNSIRQNKVDIEAAQYNVLATENNITLEVINLFINVVFAKEQLKIAENQLGTTKEQLINTTKLVEAGALPLANRLDIQAQNATNELEVINAQNNLRIAKLNLAQAMQIPFREELDVVAPELDPENIIMTERDVDEIFQVALELMPEIRAAELGVESADYGVRVAKAGYYPTLGIGASAFSNYVDQFFLGERMEFGTQIRNNFSNSGNIQLNIPILSNFRNRANVQRARLQKRLSEIQEEESRNILRQDIESAYTNANAARQSFRASEIRVSSLEESFRIAEQRFDAGAINFADYQLAQNNFFNAQADLVTSKYTYIFRVKVLDFYLGNPLKL